MSNSLKNSQRRTILKATGVGLAAASAIGSRAFAQSRSRYGIEGQLAPELELDYWIDKDGNPSDFSVAGSRGKWVLLKCFQDWCPGCHSSGFPTLQAFSERFWDHPKVAIAGIQTVFEGFSTNTVEDVRKLQLQYELPIHMAHDPGDHDTGARPQTMEKYRTGGTPWLILISPEGQVLYNNFHVNAEKMIEFVAEQVG
ncbi:MAG: peroxiredoxin family protein [Acidiferrobacterales bacterium]|nr:peroxiredoxin family protein [Acidiferrobacterales bacterium]